MSMNIKSQIKSMIALQQITFEQLAVEMTKVSGKKYTRSSLNGKFARDSISFTECSIIAKILGYHLEFVKD